MCAHHRGPTGRTAMYLRCYPYDRWQMGSHQEELRDYARRLGLGEPAVYLDNGASSLGPRPAFERLLRHTAGGGYQVLLIPGPFVFSLHDNEARALTEAIRSFGCHVLELPSPTGLPALPADDLDRAAVRARLPA
ncbi:hypothetical protein [Streptomyces kronopolitis]|uniref:hypothetical protein n=1 Tax=Streptomyces kronopolitis TaxID=1612435 RepID=UPI0020BDE020|nr:hypothetical protein [Streptomyces kronopolitis]MCL6302179.1 hypothetical protein [Streptomyces kronopolitis]